jgi:hypothetical protein
MTVLSGKSTFMIKILVRTREYRSETNFPKILINNSWLALLLFINSEIMLGFLYDQKQWFFKDFSPKT